MNSDRLLKMADFLEALPPHKFNFDSYVHLGSKEPAEALAAPEEHCGTTACAVGWMPAIFPDEMTWEKPPHDEIMPKLIGADTGIETAVSSFLDISYREYWFLFMPGDSSLDGCASAKDVAAQIRKFVASKGENCREWRRNTTGWLE